jgi:hypothetical protein
VEEHNLRQLLSEVADTEKALVHTDVSLVACEVLTLFLVSFIDGQLVNDVLLAAVLDTDETVKKMHFFVLEHVLSVSTVVHDIDLCDDTDGPRA